MVGKTNNIMDKKVDTYQNILIHFLKQEAEDRNFDQIEFSVIADTQQLHFQLVQSGWAGKRFIHHVLFHFQIKSDAKIWILANNTEILVAEELLKLGVAAEDIVLAFIPSHARKHTGFAVV